jgi:hypothetical protein
LNLAAKDIAAGNVAALSPVRSRPTYRFGVDGRARVCRPRQVQATIRAHISTLGRKPDQAGKVSKATVHGFEIDIALAQQSCDNRHSESPKINRVALQGARLFTV